MSALDRREFLQAGTLSAASLLASRVFAGGAQAESPTEQIRAGVIGLGRGLAHVSAILGNANARLAYVC
ncbi:MAG TPA: gfo/Idh/MocA family oxidoreductase, partial [Planctomycetaceae bacterium]|nr:gfo/Idh/MocA family oxidoreductase [Planctomycetaceae bacterium]